MIDLKIGVRTSVYIVSAFMSGAYFAFLRILISTLLCMVPLWVA